MEAKRITPEPVSVPDVVTLTMSLEEANLLRKITHAPQQTHEDVSILMGSINAALWKAL